MIVHDTKPPGTEEPPRPAASRRLAPWSLVARDAKVAEGVKIAALQFELAESRRRLRGARSLALVMAILFVLALISLVLVS